LAVVVHADHIRVVQRRGVLGLLAETTREIGVAQVLGAEQLDGDIASELGVGRPVDRGHAALSEQLHEPVAAAKDRPDLSQTCPSNVSVTWIRAPPTSATRSAGMVPHAPVRTTGRAPPWRPLAAVLELQAAQIRAELAAQFGPLECQFDGRLEPAHRRAGVV